MAEHDWNAKSGWSGRWERRRSRRIEVSPDFAEFLAGELDSGGYARSLTRPRRSSGVTVKPRRPGPIARAAEEAAIQSERLGPTVTSGVARVSPEYLRFLHEEISSWEYAEAVTDCAKLEGAYRAPAARFAFRQPGFFGTALWLLRLLFVIGGLAIFFLALFYILAPLGKDLASAATHSAWTMSLVGAVLVAVTILDAVSSRLREAVHFLYRFVG